MTKKVTIRTFINHPAATPETEVFFSMALCGPLGAYSKYMMYTIKRHTPL